ncbi:hypothetical protein DM222_20295 [Escherichia coli]|nr:hypothetical protein [Escherichia coli]EAB9735270.1 hypothetical protein [Escherichia coli]EFN9821254.1 hypothetical protein [Escherichia coli]EFO4721122.1 hypothetical protein [Escherichia albertii]EGE0913626.1 hypothetical protein [Escherichia coli]
MCLYLWCFPQIRPPTKLTCFPQRMEKYSCVERKSYLQERFLFASSPVRSLRSVTWLRRALPDSNITDCSNLFLADTLFRYRQHYRYISKCRV